MFIKKIFLSAISISAMLLPTLAQACSVCFSGDDDAVTHAFNWSVGFLLAAPYAIAGTIAGCPCDRLPQSGRETRRPGGAGRPSIRWFGLRRKARDE
jgi:hypothetical protein